MPETPVTEIRPHEQVLLIAVLKRSLDETSTRQLTQDVLEAAGTRARIPIVLDMTNVRFAPSVALGALVKLSNSFKLDGRRIAIIGVDMRIRDAIRVTRLDQVLVLHATLNDVLNDSSLK